MKSFRYLLCLALTFSAASVCAHVGGHDPLPVTKCKTANDCSKEEVAKGGLGVISNLVDKGKLDKSWKEVKAASNAALKDGTWIVAYNNPKEPDKAKQTFYLHISHDGYLEGASFKDK
jgi:hypothetical protein